LNKIFPYSIPENWQWTTLENVCECLDNFRSPVNTTERTKRFGNIPYYGATGQVGWINDFLTDEQLVLLGEDGAPFLDSFKSKAYIIEGKAWVNNHAHILRSNFGEIGNKFLKYYLNVFDFTDYVSGTTRLKLTQSKMKKIPIPLPPIEEQKKIVERIESLFTKLDAAKKILQKILSGYEVRRAAILHKAFIGELTEKFRAENNLSLDDWQQKILGDVLTLSKQKTNSFDEKLKYVGLENISKDSEKISYQSANGIKSAKNIFHSGDLLYGKLRPYLNKHGIPDFSGVCSTDILIFCHNELTSNEFINYFFNLPKFIEYVVSHSKGATLPRVSAKIILNYEINLPPLAEQKEIVRILDNLLDKEQRTKEIAENCLQEIDLLKKSILARAFRGEL